MADSGGLGDTADTGADRDERPGRVIGVEGRYVLLDPLGAGGTADVYAAFDRTLHRNVAIKLLRDVSLEGRLLREAQALARVRHPNVVTVHDAGLLGDRVFLAMELVSGRSLRAWLDAEPRGWRKILAVFLDAGRGLAAVHDAGLVHRDFKPDNVLIGDDGTVRVADFGLVRLSDEEVAARDETSPLVTHMTAAGNVVGTPRYMPPEQHAGGTADARSDQFSFCASLYLAVFGQAPFAGDNLDELRQNVSAGRLRAPPPERARRVPRWLLRAVRRGLATSPADRWPSMVALLGDLGSDRGKPWRRAGVATAVGLATVALVAAWMAAHGPPPCRDAGRRLDGVWDPAVQAAARRSFLASGRLDADATYGRVARALDDYTRDWVAMSTETCEATAVRHVQSDALLDRRVACLERRRGALRELTLLLRAPLTAASVDHAVAAASHLDDLPPCADTDALMATVPPSHEPRIAAVETRVAAAVALFELGRYREADAAALALFFEAPSIDYLPARARALLAVGQVARERQDVSEPMLALAEAGLRQGIVVASEARLDDDVAAGWSGLIWTGAQRGQAKQTLPFELAARGAVARARDRARLEVELAHALGYAWMAISDSTARSHLEEAVALATRVFGADSADTAHIQVDLATALHNGGHYPEAAALYSRAMDALVHAYGPSHPDVADTLALRGTTETTMGHLDEARATLQQAYDIYAKLDGAESRRALRVVGEIGLLLTQDERFEEAAGYLRRTLAGKVAALGETHKVTALWRVNLAAALIPAGQVAEARAELEAALATLAETTGPDNLFRGTALTFLAWVALEEGKPREAETHARAALAIYGTATENELYTAPPMEFIGRSLIARGRPLEAIPLLEKNLVILRGAEGDDGLNAIGAHRQLGTALLAAGRVGDALPHLEHAVAVRRTKGHDLLERATAELLLAQALRHEGQEPRARELGAAALADAEQATRGKDKADEARRWLAGKLSR